MDITKSWTNATHAKLVAKLVIELVNVNLVSVDTSLTPPFNLAFHAESLLVTHASIKST